MLNLGFFLRFFENRAPELNLLVVLLIISLHTCWAQQLWWRSSCVFSDTNSELG